MRLCQEYPRRQHLSAPSIGAACSVQEVVPAGRAHSHFSQAFVLSSLALSRAHPLCLLTTAHMLLVASGGGERACSCSSFFHRSTLQLHSPSTGFYFQSQGVRRMCRRENQASSPPLEIQVHLLSLLTFLSAVACILPGFSELKHWPLVPSRWDSDISEHAEKKCYYSKLSASHVVR